MQHDKGLKRMSDRLSTRTARTGFTLIELLLVVGLIFILLGIVQYVGGRVLKPIAPEVAKPTAFSPSHTLETWTELPNGNRP
jgi:hypothetical protein